MKATENRSATGRPVAMLLLALLMGVPATALWASVSAAAPARPGWASDAVLVPPAAELTAALIARGKAYRQAPPARQPALLSELLELAATRAALLRAMAADDPGAVLRVAIPAHVRALLPPAVQALLESEAELEGTLEVLVEDGPHGHVYRYALRAGAARVALHFAGEGPGLLTGSRVRARGVRVGEALALDPTAPGNFEALSAALPNTFGEQRTAVILVTFQDNPVQPYTASYARDVVFATTSSFDREVSYEQAWLGGDVFGWYTIPVSSTTCDTNGIANHAQAAARAAGADLSTYRRFVYAFPTNACSWWGYGTVGGNPSHAWVKGSFTLRVVGHEMGHNFGLYHARALDCGASVIEGSCTVSEYGDTMDIMGAASGHFSAFQKERLGWLDYQASPPITTVAASGTYAIEPLAQLGSGPKALKILKSIDPASGARTWYYVEQRRAQGFDGFLSNNANVLGGVVVHVGSEASGRSIDLLDMTPATASFSDPALVVGASFSDALAGVTITPLAVGPGGASVAVSFGAAECVRANPALSISPSQSQWVAPGGAVDYAVTVHSNDGSGCGAATFDLRAAVPAGWNATFTTPALALAPGASASTTLRVTSAATAADGFHDVTITATNRATPTLAASATVTYVVVSSLTVSLTTDRASYTRKQGVAITASVHSGGAAVAGASVLFTITKPNGAVTSQLATTKSNGAAKVQFRAKGSDPSGTYSVRADASMGGLSGTATTTFILQ